MKLLSSASELKRDKTVEAVAQAVELAALS
jgi:hypothetical protein